MFPSLTTPTERGSSRYSSYNYSNSSSNNNNSALLAAPSTRAVSRDGSITSRSSSRLEGTQSLTGPSTSRRPSLNKLISTPSPLRAYRSHEPVSPSPSPPSSGSPSSSSSYSPSSMSNSLAAPRRHQRTSSGDAVATDLANGVARVSIREVTPFLLQ
jgi:hypothetical protein